MSTRTRRITIADADHLQRSETRFDLMMIEHRSNYDDIADHAALQRRLRTPICLDESIKERTRAATDLTRCVPPQHQSGRVGGFAESIRLHDLCAARGIPVWHCGMLEIGNRTRRDIHLSTLPNFSLPGDGRGQQRYFRIPI